MAKADKLNKKVASKKADVVKEKPTAVKTAKEILAKAAALTAKPTKKAKANGVKTISPEDSSSQESSSEESESSEEESPPTKSAATPSKKEESSDSSSASDSDESSDESDSDEDERGKVSTLVKATPAKTQKDSSDDSSDSDSGSESSSDDGEDVKMTSVPTKTPTKAKDASDSEDDSDASNSEESSSSEDGSDEVDETSAPINANANAQANKKRKADNEAVAPPKKVKLASNGDADAMATSEEIKSIFVGRLSWNVDNDWLAQEFEECGEVESAHVQMDRNTGRSRGFGYVHFKSADAVEKALALNGKEIDGRAVNIDKSNTADKKTSMEKRAQYFGDTASPPSAVLFVGNLSFSVSEDALWETFGEHGDVKSVRVPTDRDTGKPKGFAYVEFSEIGAAKEAHAALQGLELEGRSIRLDFSQPRDSAGGGRGGGGRGGRGRGGFGGDRGRGGFGGDRGRGGFGGDRGRGFSRGGRGDRGGRGRGRGARFEGQKTTF